MTIPNAIDAPPIDINEVLDDLTTQLARSLRDNAVLRAQLAVSLRATAALQNAVPQNNLPEDSMLPVASPQTFR